ncbi:MAG: hypothetical protein ACKO1M_12400 [Planctomycetota bacterium]
MITLCDVLVVIAILGCAYWGWLVGLHEASVAALELLACLAGAVLLHEFVAGWLHATLVIIMGDWVPQAWSVALAFSGLAWGSFAGIRFWLHRTSLDDQGDVTKADPLWDRLAGGVAGGFGGALFAGGVLITVSMVPFLAGLKPSGDRMLLDVGKTVLRASAQFLVDGDQPRPLPLWGEPASKMSVISSRLTSEPWFDSDDDGAFGDSDRFRDVDGNGVFTKDLYFEDVDADGIRLVGLIDKYVAGRWDGLLKSDDRPRPEPPKTPAAGPQRPTQSAKQTATGKVPAKPQNPDRKEPARPDSQPAETSTPPPPVPAPEKKPDDDF